MIRPRWRRAEPDETHDLERRLARWPCEVGGATRHMFALAALEAHGADVLRVSERRDRWAACVVMPGRVLVPCGDGEIIAAAGSPVRRWRLLVGDVDSAEPLLAADGQLPGQRVHVQRFLTVEPDHVPTEAELPDPGLRRAEPRDVPALARLAVQLHMDDEFGPDPGRTGLRGYASRLEDTVRRGLVWCLGSVGAPVMKLERSVSSERYGVQLAGICVDRAARGRGLGTAAVAAAVRHALRDAPGRPVSLHVRAANTPALKAYARAGFVDREEWRLAVRP